MEVNALGTLQELGFPISDGWWVSHPERALIEISKMIENTESKLDCVGSELLWDERITTDFGSIYQLRIHSGSFFPFLPPKVFAYDESGRLFSAEHLYGDGSLCLFEQKQYQSTMSILEIRNMACAWCFCHDGNKATGEWLGAEADHSPLNQPIIRGEL